ncbi:protein of unknown function [Methylorubrum extorquens]|uniref:Uncharacterized protein n=1 Tax=Methylorubrum extorquens TaxID=408 RepID=A0A2N9AW60_METEX|nr:protein of unknown function [Methylorubrum extorquens]
MLRLVARRGGTIARAAVTTGSPDWTGGAGGGRSDDRAHASSGRPIASRDAPEQVRQVALQGLVAVELDIDRGAAGLTVDADHPAPRMAPDPEGFGEVEPIEHDLIAGKHRRTQHDGVLEAGIPSRLPIHRPERSFSNRAPREGEEEPANRAGIREKICCAGGRIKSIIFGKSLFQFDNYRGNAVWQALFRTSRRAAPEQDGGPLSPAN